MTSDRSILLQKLVRDNSEDLQSEFLDLRNWEEQMRRKDQQLLKESSQYQDSLPPIRTKKQKKPETKQTGGDASKSKRIRSYDYTSWEKFDVEKACKDLDKEDESDESVDEEFSQEQLEENHDAASKHKQEGNIFVQHQKWDKAIACYSKAIKIFPYDAVFYANRALCHIKMDNLYSAESDCTMAVQLDESYVKAYHRRAMARIGLKQYKEAKEDLERVLKLEPSNKETKSLLAEVNKKIESSKSVIFNETKDNTSIEKKIGEKIFNRSKVEKGKENNVKKEDINKTRANTKINEVKRLKEDQKEELRSDAKKSASCEIQTETQSEDKSDVTVDERDLRIPEWLPEKDDVAVVEPISEPAHLKSKKPLEKITVEEVEFVIGKKDKINGICCLQSESAKGAKLEETNTCKKETIAEKVKQNSKVSELVETILDIPSVPKTAVQFIRDWKMCKSSEYRYKYLKQLSPNSLPMIFQDSMEPDIFSDIVTVLQSEFIKREEPVFQILEDLSHVKRFRALVMFIDNADKDGLRNLFEYCETIENRPSDEIQILRDKYEI